MAQLFLRTDDGKEIPLEKVEGIGIGKIMVVRAMAMLKPTDKESMEFELSKKFDRKVIVLDSRYGELLSLKE